MTTTNTYHVALAHTFADTGDALYVWSAYGPATRSDYLRCIGSGVASTREAATAEAAAYINR